MDVFLSKRLLELSLFVILILVSEKSGMLKQKSLLISIVTLLLFCVLSGSFIFGAFYFVIQSLSLKRKLSNLVFQTSLFVIYLIYSLWISSLEESLIKSSLTIEKFMFFFLASFKNTPNLLKSDNGENNLVKYLSILLICYFIDILLLLPFDIWIKKGMFSNFSLNFVQAWVLTLSKGFFTIFSFLLFAIKLLVIREVFSRSKSSTIEIINVDFKQIKLRKINAITYVFVLSIIVFETIIVRNEHYLGGLFLIFTLLYLFVIQFLNSLKLLHVFFIGILSFLAFNESSFENAISVFSGLLSVQNIFQYYNELYMLYAFDANIYVAIILLISSFFLLRNFRQCIVLKIDSNTVLLGILLIPIIEFFVH